VKSLYLANNNFLEKLSIRYLADSLIKRNCPLEELDLQKCGLN
jgi:hypothetical protein